MVPVGAIVRFLGKLSGSPRLAGADPLLDRSQEYGTAPGLPQARKYSFDVPRTASDSRRGRSPKVNQFCPT
jgi:hypothetical protein